MVKAKVRFTIARTVDVWVDLDDCEDSGERLGDFSVTDLNEQGQDRAEYIANAQIILCLEEDANSGTPACSANDSTSPQTDPASVLPPEDTVP